MDHSYFRDKVSAYADNELPLDERRVIDEHLAECPECRALLKQIESLSRLAESHRDLAGDDVFEAMACRIDMALGVEDAPVTSISGGKWRGLGWKLAAVAASLAVLTFIGLHTDEIGQIVGRSQTKQVTTSNEAPHVPEMSDEARKYRAEPHDEARGAEDRTPEPAAEESVDRRMKTLPAPAAVTDEASDLAKKAAPVEATPQRKSDLPGKKATGDTGEHEFSMKGAEPPTTAKQQTLATDTSIRVMAQQDEVTRFVAPESAASAEGVAAEVKEVVDRDLDFWRHQRDSLLPLYRVVTAPLAKDSGKKELVPGFAQQTPAVNHALEAAGKARLKPETIDTAAVQAGLAEALYQVARLSDSDGEKGEAVTRLREIAGTSSGALAAKAAEYLRMLEAGK